MAKKKAEPETTVTTPTPRHRYTTSYVGKSEKGGYAFQVGGNLTRTVELRADKNQNPIVLASIGIGGNAWRMLAIAEGTYDKNADYPDDSAASFINLIASGDVAKQMEGLPKGASILVSGPIFKHTYAAPDGSERTSVRISVNSFARLGNQAQNVQPVIPKTPGYAKEVFTKRDGTDGSNNIATLVSGKVFRVFDPSATSDGTPVFSFSMFAQCASQQVYDIATGKQDGTGYDAQKTLVSVSVFGRQAETLAKLVKAGMVVCVSGAVSKRDVNGQEWVQIRLGGLDVLKYPDANANAPTPAADGEAPVDEEEEFTDVPGDDDDDELPL